ncbi:MAG: hypothetical protein IJK67_05045 [Bacilli bacterium]|nr:hypothetical protein [Bacilli bacterium]
MKKIVVLLMTVLLLSACSLSNTPSGKVEAFLNEYTSMSDSVKADMETKVESENLSEENKKVYLDVLTRQYKNLKYSIKDESIDGNKATVRAKVTVYDLYKIDKDSVNYMNNNSTEFIDENGAYSDNLFNKYRLNEMLKTNETVEYDIDFYLNQVNGEWVIESPDRIALEKIHGLYNYD